jgi:N-methylhydantoinase A/oxoprolinase/acetone carboxylase beta subunit
VSGEFTPWDVEIARKVTQWVACYWKEDEEAFILRVKDQFTRKIVAEIIQLLSGRTLSEPESGIHGKNLDRWLFEENMSASNLFFGSRLFLKVPIVGIGAPAKAFLPQVARTLATEIVFPNNFEVANAVGAAVGHVIIRREGEVYPCVEGSTITGYFARVAGMQKKFIKYQEALVFAKESLIKAVYEESQNAGGNQKKVEIEVKEVVEGMARLHAWSIS